MEFDENNPEKAMTYDFRKEIMTFKARENNENNALDCYIIYEATGLTKYPKDPNVEKAAKEICKNYIDGEIPGKSIHADTCALLRKIWKELWRVSCKDGENLKIDAMDTMNSCNTTINALLKTRLLLEENKGILEGLGGEKYFYFPNKFNQWAIEKSILLYDKDEKWFAELIGEKAKAFLNVAYTIGNFIPCPQGCNRPAASLTKDYWDLTLYYIYCWYHDESDDRGRHLEKIFWGDRYREKHIESYKKWLEAFSSWDNFIEANYLQNYTERTTKPYGCPKEFWKDHFSSREPLPQTPEQIEAFFAHATKCIKARSKRMVDELRKRSQNQQSK